MKEECEGQYVRREYLWIRGGVNTKDDEPQDKLRVEMILSTLHFCCWPSQTLGTDVGRCRV